MPEAIEAALARRDATTPLLAREFSGMSQVGWADWWGISVNTVSRAEEEGHWKRYPKPAGRQVTTWLAMFGPDPEQAFRAVGRWSMFKDIRHAGDAMYVRAVEGQPLLEAIAAAKKVV